MSFERKYTDWENDQNKGKFRKVNLWSG